MQACTYSHHYATPSLTTQPVPVPNTATGQVLVKVYAAAINQLTTLRTKALTTFYLTLSGREHLGLILRV